MFRACVQRFLVIFLASLALSGCLVRRRVVTRQGKHDTRPLLTATKQDLLDRVRSVYDATKSFSATVDMTPALGSVYKGDIEEFPGVRGYILFEQPERIRIIGLDPVIRSKAFDMVSSGTDFHLLIPSKNRFIEGRNDAPAVSKNKLENLRPAAFLHAMLVMPPDPATEASALIDDTDEEKALYMLLILHHKDPDILVDRAIYFDRLSLQIVRQKVYDSAGDIISDTRYQDWKPYGASSFPTTIDINRPKDGYGVIMTVLKLEMNPTLTADKFNLTQPEGTTLQVIGQPSPAGTR